MAWSDGEDCDLRRPQSGTAWHKKPFAQFSCSKFLPTRITCDMARLRIHAGSRCGRNFPPIRHGMTKGFDDRVKPSPSIVRDLRVGTEPIVGCPDSVRLTGRSRSMIFKAHKARRRHVGWHLYRQDNSRTGWCSAAQTISGCEESHPCHRTAPHRRCNR